jgi:hypothetical protein
MLAQLKYANIAAPAVSQIKLDLIKSTYENLMDILGVLKPKTNLIISPALHLNKDLKTCFATFTVSKTVELIL